jgi:subtilisin family serine protease
VVSLIQALAGAGIYSQPNYVYGLAQNGAPPAPAPATSGAPEQYVVQKLKLNAVHQLVKGDHVLVAVIDSAIDPSHPDIAGAIAGRFDAVGKHEKPHVHGTGIAGAIVAHRTLTGVAPDVKILAIHAFSFDGKATRGTTFEIIKALDWAIRRGARIVNMSFAGPPDPSLAKAFQTAHAKGVVLIAAAGNAGPKSPPLFPGADPNVIAVTATDAEDHIFSGANRGKYITASAPGVDVIAPAPAGSYQLMTGTSIAAAHVTGVVALLLQHRPSLDPDTIREALTASATHLGPSGDNLVFGSGLIDPIAAIKWVDEHPRPPKRPGTSALTPTRQSARR